MNINSQPTFGSTQSYATALAERTIRASASPRMSENIESLPRYGGDEIQHVLDKSPEGDFLDLATVFKDATTGQAKLSISSKQVDGLNSNGYSLLEKAFEHVQAMGVAVRKGLSQPEIDKIGTDKLIQYAKLDDLIEKSRT